MRLNVYLIPGTLTLLIAAGCNHRTTSDYPDKSLDTHYSVDAINRDAEAKNLSIDRRLNGKLTALSFDEKQIADNAANQRSKIELESDKIVEPLMASKMETNIESMNKCERIDKELAANKQTVNQDEREKLVLNAEQEKAEVKRKSSEIINQANRDIKEAKFSAENKIADVDVEERKMLADIARQRSEAERKAREDKLAVSVQKNKELTEVAETSAKERVN